MERKRVFKERVRAWAAKLDVDVVWLGVRPMRNKWASCSTNGYLNFNAELLDLKQSLWDYVIVHEFFCAESWKVVEKFDERTFGGL